MPDAGTPTYDAVVDELGDPSQHSEAFDQGLAELDDYIDDMLHGNAGQDIK